MQFPNIACFEFYNKRKKWLKIFESLLSSIVSGFLTWKSPSAKLSQMAHFFSGYIHATQYTGSKISFGLNVSLMKLQNDQKFLMQ